MSVLASLLASSDVFDDAAFDITIGVLFMVGGLVFLTDLGGLATRWQGTRMGRRPQDATPEQQRLQQKLLRYRHVITLVLGLALIGLGLSHL